MTTAKQGKDNEAAEINRLTKGKGSGKKNLNPDKKTIADLEQELAEKTEFATEEAAATAKVNMMLNAGEIQINAGNQLAVAYMRAAWAEGIHYGLGLREGTAESILTECIKKKISMRECYDKLNMWTIKIKKKMSPYHLYALSHTDKYWDEYHEDEDDAPDPSPKLKWSKQSEIMFWPTYFHSYSSVYHEIRPWFMPYLPDSECSAAHKHIRKHNMLHVKSDQEKHTDQLERIADSLEILVEHFTAKKPSGFFSQPK